MKRGNHSLEKVVGIENVQHAIDEKEPSCRESRSHHGLSDDNFFNTPEMLYREKFVQQEMLSLDARNNNNLFQHSRNPFLLDLSPKKIIPRHLEPESCTDAKTSSYEFTIPNLNEMDLLRMQLTDEEFIDRRLQKEREESIIKAFEEKQTILR